MEEGLIDPDWLVVGHHAKEREVKEKARLFSLLVPEIRYYFSATEKNLEMRFFPDPGQTMTLPEHLLTDRMSSLTNHLRRDGFVTVAMSLDIKMYNQSLSAISTREAFRTNDQTFGTPGLFSFTREFLLGVHVFFLSSRYNPPDHLKNNIHAPGLKLTIPVTRTYQETATTWLGQEGGLEGLRQKGWTAFLMSAVLTVGHKMCIHADLVGQEHNQVLLIQFPIPEMAKGLSGKEFPEEVSRMIEEYAQRILKVLDGIGLTLKLEETYSSLRLVNYGKDMYFDGVPLTSFLKKICRMFPESTDVYPMLDNRIASIYSAALSAAGKSVDSIVPDWMTLIEHYRLLTRQFSVGYPGATARIRALKRRGAELSSREVMISLFLTVDFGGFCHAVLSIPISWSPRPSYILTDLDQRSQPGCYRDRSQEMDFSYARHDEVSLLDEFLRLVMDPLNLNMKDTSGIQQEHRRLLDRKVRELVKNDDIRLLQPQPLIP